MKCLVLDGRASPGRGTAASERLDRWLGAFAEGLEGRGHQVERLALADLEFGFCNGCWSCWWKTPGLCAQRDGAEVALAAMARADLVVFATPLSLGTVSSLVKKTQDRFIPLIHPYIRLEGGEIHHWPRYAKLPDIGLVVEPGPEDGDADLAVVRRLFGRFARNAGGDFALFATVDTPTTAALEAVLERRGPARPDPVAPPAREEWTLPSPPPRVSEVAPRRLFVNGSPRGKSSNSRHLLNWIVEGMSAAGIGDAAEIPIVDLGRQGELAAQVEAVREADEILVILPLYADSLPGLVMRWFEALAAKGPALRGKRVAFFVQSGFPEAIHSEAVAVLLARLSRRLGWIYAGTLVRGGIEGVRIQPPAMTRKTRQACLEAGRAWALRGGFDAALVRRVAGMRRLGALGGIVFRVLASRGVMNQYWDYKLKKNGAFERRFDAPYGPAYAEGRS